MIRIKFEVEEQETEPLPIESENVGSPSDDKVVVPENNGNNKKTKPTKFDQSIQQQEIPIRIQQQQQQQSFVSTKIETIVPDNHQEAPSFLDQNSTSDSVAVGLNSIKTEPAESSLLLTTQLNHSLTIQSLLRQNRIQKGWTTNESTSSIGTKQQQQSFPLPKTEPIVSEIHQEVPLSLDLSSLILNLDSEETSNYDTSEIQSLDQSALIPIEQQQQQFFVLPKIEPIFPEIHQEVSLFLDQSSLIPNPNFVETTTTNCDITTEMFPGLCASLGRRAKLNVCYSVPMEPEPVPRRRKKLPKPSLPSPSSADNSESASNDNDQHSGSGSISGFDTSTTAQVAALSPPPEAVPLLVGKKPLSRVPPLTLEERNARKRENDRLLYHRQKANPKPPVDPEIMAEKKRRKSEYNRKYKQQRLASATPEQLELMRLKELERIRRRLENESEEQRQRRLERMRQYDRTVRKQRKKQWLASATPKQRELMRLKYSEVVRRQLEKETEEQRQKRRERARQYYRTVGKQRLEQKRQTLTPEEREKKRAIYREKYKNRKLIMEKNKKSLEESQIGQSQSSTSMSSSSINLVDNSESSTWIGGGEESNSQTTNLESPKPGPSKLSRPTRCQSNAKSEIYLEPFTDSEDSDWDS